MNAKEKFLNDIKSGMSIDEATRQCDAPRFACLIWARDAGLAIPAEAKRIACRNQQVGMKVDAQYDQMLALRADIQTMIQLMKMVVILLDKNYRGHKEDR